MDFERLLIALGIVLITASMALNFGIVAAIGCLGAVCLFIGLLGMD